MAASKPWNSQATGNVKILVLYTGGTIGMAKNYKGELVPQLDKFKAAIYNDKELNVRKRDDGLYQVPPIDTGITVNYMLQKCGQLVDSSDMSAEHWTEIAKKIGAEYDQWDGFVILQGTDTLAYTSSVLSFLLRNIKKPVIVTGAQIPIFDPGNDARHNILASLRFAASGKVKEVCVCFANKLMRGNRVVKYSAEALEAFQSPNYGVLGDVASDLKVDDHLTLPASEDEPIFSYDVNKNVILLQVFPTMSAKKLQNALNFPNPPNLQKDSPEGVVLLTFGAGNIPKDLSETLKEASNAGVIIINVTQCPQGTVRPIYENGKILNDSGVLEGFDMTAEAAFTKLCYVLGLKGLTLDERKSLMMENLSGEYTETDKKC